MSRKKKKAAQASAAKAQQQQPPTSPKANVLRLLTPLSQGQKYHSPKLASWGSALWRGSTRFSKTFLSFAGVALLNSTRASLNLARKTPKWLRANWNRRVALLKPSPPSKSLGTTPLPSPPRDALESANSGLMQQQIKALEDLQRAATQLVEQRAKSSNIHLDHHFQRTEAGVSVSIRSTSSIRIESAGDSGTAGQRYGGNFDDGPSARMGSAGERSAASPRAVEKVDDSAPVMIESGSEPSFASPTDSSPTLESAGDTSVAISQEVQNLDDELKDQILAHMDLVMQRLPLPALATVSDKRSKDLDKHRKLLRADVLHRYGAKNSKGEVWCCIRREWVESQMVRTAHLCPVSVGEAYLQYVFGDEGPHVWNAENAIPISTELEEALDAGQLAIVPAEDEASEPDDLFLWDIPDASIPAEKRFKVVVFDEAVRTRDGKFTARDLHGRLLGFQNPDFRPGMRYICFNVVTTLARRMRYKVVGASKDLDRLGDSRFMLSPGKFIRDSWLLRMCAQVGLDINGENNKSSD